MGRGNPVTTQILNVMLGFSGGDAHTAYTSIPHAVSHLKSVFLDTVHVSWVDPLPLRWTVRGTHMKGGWLGGSVKEMVETYTTLSGRMTALPHWTQTGAIVALQGGQQKVQDTVDMLLDNKIPVAGVWVQDWSGRRLHRVSGKDQFRLWWNVRH